MISQSNDFILLQEYWTRLGLQRLVASDYDIKIIQQEAWIARSRAIEGRNHWKCLDAGIYNDTAGKLWDELCYSQYKQHDWMGRGTTGNAWMRGFTMTPLANYKMRCVTVSTNNMIEWGRGRGTIGKAWRVGFTMTPLANYKTHCVTSRTNTIGWGGGESLEMLGCGDLQWHHRQTIRWAVLQPVQTTWLNRGGEPLGMLGCGDLQWHRWQTMRWAVLQPVQTTWLNRGQGGEPLGMLGCEDLQWHCRQTTRCTVLQSVQTLWLNGGGDYWECLDVRIYNDTAGKL